jgi:hypothetical protein
MHDLGALVVGEGGGEAVAFVGEAGVVDAEGVEQGGVPVEVTDFIDDGFVAPFIGLAMDVAAFEATAGDPLTKAVGVVVTTPFVASGVVLKDG